MRMSCLLLAFHVWAAWALAGEQWPQYRGPNGQGHAEAAGLPIHWSETENVKWKTPIPHKGWSSPVIWNNQIWLTTALPDGKELFALGLDRSTGKIIHHLKVFEVPKPAFCHPFNSYASPTPVLEEGRAYVHFGTYGTACIDSGSGKILWTRRDFPCDHFRGPGSSPILFGGLLYVHFDGYDQQYLVALDKNTGKTVWRKDRSVDYGGVDGDAKKAYGTPAIIEVNGRPLLVSTSSNATYAYEPSTGEEIWHVVHGGMNAASPPLSGLGKVFLNTGDGGFRLFALRPDGQGDVTKTHVDWKFNRSAPSRCSPLLIGDLLYVFNEGGISTCLEARTGRQIWHERLVGQFSSSPIYADGHIYFAGQDGPTYVLEPGPVFKVLASNKLDDGCMASPAAVGRSLFLRTRTQLYCLEQK